MMDTVRSVRIRVRIEQSRTSTGNHSGGSTFELEAVMPDANDDADPVETTQAVDGIISIAQGYSTELTDWVASESIRRTKAEKEAKDA